MTVDSLHRAVFLDRDGTIIEEVSYLSNLEDVRLIPGADTAISILNKAGFKVIVVTNQSGIARGFFNEDFVMETHRELQSKLARNGAQIDAWYYCPHHPDQGAPPYRKICSCRKPGIGMIEEAAKELKIDIRHSFMIGDSLRDLETGWRAGMKSILVLTGYGKRTLDEMGSKDRARISFVAKDLLHACQWIVDRCPSCLRES